MLNSKSQILIHRTVWWTKQIPIIKLYNFPNIFKYWNLGFKYCLEIGAWSATLPPISVVNGGLEFKFLGV